MSSKADFTPTLPRWIELSLGEGGQRHVFFKRKKGAHFSVEQLAIAVGTKGESTKCGKREDVGECVYTWVPRGAAPLAQTPAVWKNPALHGWTGSYFTLVLLNKVRNPCGLHITGIHIQSRPFLTSWSAAK